MSDPQHRPGEPGKVQDAISSAKTTVDIQNIRTALGRLYNDGTISAREFNQNRTAVRQDQELKAAGEEGAKGMQAVAESSDRAAKSLSDQRKAIGESMEATRKGVASTKDDMGAFEGFFGGVLSTARQGVAQLSQEALNAFDAMRGSPPSISASTPAAWTPRRARWPRSASNWPGSRPSRAWA
ncbi:hypothetical protein P4050_14485 [Pseudomonas aeruginosa]|nr:hypothetical protein [Pseudomonas aeruginosa]